MMHTYVNPTWLNPVLYVNFLNQSFPGEWDRNTFNWYCRRPFNGRASDLIVRAEGERILAGVSCCYRQLKDAHGRILEVCILSAGSTLRSERGGGHYVALLQSALTVSREAGCDAIVGFTTRENASGRGLARLGAHAIPSFYLVASKNHRRLARRRLRSAASASKVGDIEAPVTARGVVSFHYANPLDWRSQFLHRPQAVLRTQVGHDTQALLEPVANTDRLQYLNCPDPKTITRVAMLANESHERGRDFFMYTMDPLLAQAARRRSFAVRGGYLHLLPLNPQRDSLQELTAMRWRVQSGDRL